MNEEYYKYIYEDFLEPEPIERWQMLSLFILIPMLVISSWLV